MDAVRDVCSSTSALRKAAGLRNRLPLASLTVVVDDAAALAGFEGIVADELNVKAVRLLDLGAPEAASYGVSRRLSVNARAAGPRLGKDVQLAIKKMSVQDFADAIGITPANVAVLKNGRAKAVRFTTLEAICRVLECQPGDILRWVPDSEEQ